MIYDVIVIGGGPAGLTAATYIRRAGKSVLVIEKAAFGGQITRSTNVENFPGYISVSGAQIGDMLLEQAMNQGAEVELEEVVSVSAAGEEKTVVCASGAEYTCRALIIATGAKPRTLGLENEERLTGSGVCYCSVCDGAFFAGQDVAVSGGGNSALSDAMLLSEICRKVYLIHRRGSFRGEAMLVEALRGKANVEFVLEDKRADRRGRALRCRGRAGRRAPCAAGVRALRLHRPRARYRSFQRAHLSRQGRLRRLGRGLPDRLPRRFCRGRLPRKVRPPAHDRHVRRLRRGARSLRMAG